MKPPSSFIPLSYRTNLPLSYISPSQLHTLGVLVAHGLGISRLCSSSGVGGGGGGGGVRGCLTESSMNGVFVPRTYNSSHTIRKLINVVTSACRFSFFFQLFCKQKRVKIEKFELL